MEQARRLSVSISFNGGQFSDLRPSPSHNQNNTLSSAILNYDQSQTWRSLPQSLIGTSGTQLPIGVQTYKIEVDTDGIYELSYAHLENAGMNVTAVDPQTFQMLHKFNIFFKVI